MKRDPSIEHARILVVRLSSIGDVMHVTTVVHNLKLCYPACHVTWLVSPPADVLLRGNPDIDRLLVWDRRKADRAFAHFHPGEGRQCFQEASRLLAPYTFDLTLDIQGLFLTGILSRMSGAPRRIGIHERHEGNFLFMTEMAPDTGEKHKIRRYMTALRPLGIETLQPGPVLRIPEELEGFAAGFWEKHGVDSARPILMVNTRTTWPDKNWPPERFGQAVELAGLPEEIQVVFCGASEDLPYIEQAQAKMKQPGISIAGETDLMELAALFRSAALLLTGDTGPLYIAEAVGLRTLSLWGPTHPNIYGPLTEGHEFIITPHGCHSCCKTKCRHRTNACMHAISPEVVADRLWQLMASEK